MTWIDRFASRLTYLKSRLTPFALKYLESLIQSNLSKDLDGGPIAQYLTLDILYPLVRHYIWTNHPSFLEVHSTYLATSYGLKKEQCENILEKTRFSMRRLRQIPKLKMFHSGPEHFYFYLIVQTLTCPNESLLDSDIGLGYSILRKIKEAASFSFNDTQQNQKEMFFFDNEQQMLFLDLIDKLSKAREKSPWCLDCYQLFYLLADAGSTPELNPNSEFLRQTLQLLVNLGYEKSVKLTQFLDQLNTVNKQTKNNHAQGELIRFTDSKVLIRHLVSKELIYTIPKIETSNPPLEQTIVSLTDIGYQLTAELFAYLSFKNLPKGNIHPCWHTARILNKIRTLSKSPKTLVGQCRNLSPTNLRKVFNNLAHILKESELLELCERLLDELQTVGQRNIICDVLAGAGNENGIKILGAIAKSDRSRQVRDHATMKLYECGFFTSLDEIKKYRSPDPTLSSHLL